MTCVCERLTSVGQKPPSGGYMRLLEICGWDEEFGAGTEEPVFGFIGTPDQFKLLTSAHFVDLLMSADSSLIQLQHLLSLCEFLPPLIRF